MLDLRADLRQDAMAFYQGILHQVDATDQEVRADTCRALGELAIYQVALGHQPDAVTSLRQAIQLAEALRREQPEKEAYRRLHADCLMKLGVPLRDLNRHDQAVTVLEQAIELFGPIAQAETVSPSDKELMAL